MKKSLCCLAIAVCLVCAANAQASTYFLYEQYGGTWYDAEKTASNTNDDLMCWAATAANMLTWTNWSSPYATGDADAVFSYYQDHWTDAGGSMYYGVDWWFDGTNDTQGWSGWSQVDQAGGGFYSNLNFQDYYSYSSNDSQAKTTLETYLNEGRATGLSITNGSGGHAVTVWGYGTEDGLYKIWLTDSDNSKSSDDPLDLLLSYALVFEDGAWFLQDFYGSDSWYITEVHGLAQHPTPIPGAVWLFGSGLIGLAGLRRRYA